LYPSIFSIISECLPWSWQARMMYNRYPLSKQLPLALYIHDIPAVKNTFNLNDTWGQKPPYSFNSILCTFIHNELAWCLWEDYPACLFLNFPLRREQRSDILSRYDFHNNLIDGAVSDYHVASCDRCNFGSVNFCPHPTHAFGAGWVPAIAFNLRRDFFYDTYETGILILFGFLLYNPSISDKSIRSSASTLLATIAESLSLSPESRFYLMHTNGIIFIDD